MSRSEPRIETPGEQSQHGPDVGLEAISQRIARGTPNRVAILGVGLLGGSFGLAIRRKYPLSRVVGCSRSSSSRDMALHRGAVDEATDDARSACRDADLVVVATPVDRIAEMVIVAAEASRPDALVTDLGSTKAEIVKAVEADWLARSKFIGAHPIAGGEKTGAEHAREDLFRGRPVVLTPTPNTAPERLARSVEIWQELGGHVMVMSPEDHDRNLASTSHVPHLVASMLAGLLPDEARGLVGSGWLDTTRIASGDPEMWAAICLANRLAISHVLDQAIGSLRRFQEAVLSGDRDELFRLLESAKRMRDEALPTSTAG